MTEGSGKNAATYSVSEGTTKEIQRVALNTNAGVEIGTSAAPVQVTLANTGANSTAVKVDGSAVTQPVSLTSTTITGTAAVTQSGTWTNTVTQATAASLNATVVGTGTFATQSVSAGDVAHDGVDSGNPVKQGFKATTSIAGLTLVSDGDRTNGFAGVDGVQIVRPYCNLEDIVTSFTSCTSGANTSVISAQGSGIKFYLIGVVLFNNGTSNGSCIITDGSGGTTKLKIPFPASTGTVFSPEVPIPFSANTAVFADPSGSDTIDVTIIGFKSKV